MNFKGILFFLGIYSFIIAFFALLNILYSLYFDFLLDLKSYLICFVFSFLFGSYSYFIGKKYTKDLKIFDQILIIFISFILLPLFISIPYFFSSYNFGFINSYFESISGFTGTGFSIIEKISLIDNPLILWRSSSQWIGGLFFLIFILATLGTKTLRIKPVYLLNEAYETGNFYNNFFSNIFKIVFIYFVTTLVILLLYIFCKIRFFDAFNLAFTTISAGGFLSRENLSLIIINNLQTLIFGIGLLLSILNFYLFYKLIFNKFKITEHYEDFYLIFFIFLFVFIFYFFLINEESFLNIFLIVVSCLSTSGIGFYYSNIDLSLLLLLITIIGGSAISCSSGFKFLRFYILIKASFNEMNKLVKPINVFNNKLFNTSVKLEEQDIKNCFLIFILFLLSLFILSGILTIENISFENSFKLSILTLTNTATSTMFGFFDFNFSDLSNVSKIFLIIFMLLGKLEIIAFLILIKKLIFKG